MINVNGLNLKSNHIIEYIIFFIVIFASTSIVTSGDVIENDILMEVGIIND